MGALDQNRSNAAATTIMQSTGNNQARSTDAPGNSANQPGVRKPNPAASRPSATPIAVARAIVGMKTRLADTQNGDNKLKTTNVMATG